MKNNTQKRLKYKHILSIVLAAIMTFTLSGFDYTGSPLLDEIKQVLKNYYVSDLPEQVYGQASINDLIKEINKTDPYTKYYSKSQYNEFVNTFSYNPSLMGVQLRMTNEGARIEAVTKASPEAGAGLLVGDIVVLADNHILIGVKLELANKYILGEEGKTVKLRVKREAKYLTVNVLRIAKKNSTVEGQVLDKHIGYIKISSFGEDTEYLFESKLSQYKKLNVDSYIVDLRYNNGGFFNIALDIAGFFIGNSPALITKNRLLGEKKYYGTFQGQLISRPVVFLINGHSASATEILAAAMKDYKRGLLIGSKTYGKGSIQWPAKLSNNDVLKLTIEKFYSPKGSQIDKTGVLPDVALPDDMDSLRFAQLLLSTKTNVVDTRDYVKINYGGKTIILNTSRASTPLFWRTYHQLLELAANKGRVWAGNGLAWTALTKSQISDYAKMYFPAYKKTITLSNVDIDSQFTLQFGADLTADSFDAFQKDGIELIDAGSGARVPVSLKLSEKRNVVVTPVEDLLYGESYYLIVHPFTYKQTKSSANCASNGMINEISTIANKYSAQPGVPVGNNSSTNNVNTNNQTKTPLNN